MATVNLENGRQKRINGGHPWVYRTEITSIQGDYSNGDIVDVIDFRQKYLGRGFINDNSMITVRLLTHKDEEINPELITSRVKKAVAYRQYFMRDNTDSYRIIFGEADLLPGVIADKFGSCIVLQILALGMEKWQNLIADTLISLLSPQSLLLRNDEPIRLKEGLPLETKSYFGTTPDEISIKENDLSINIDILHGQKTGYFLDQKDNHAALKPFVKNKKVLDCFTYIGAFALHAAKYGAKEVLAVDISEDAVKRAQKNALLNGYSNISFETANAFDFLKTLEKEHANFDVIILDPPAFTKSKSALAGATRGYKEINLRAMKLLPAGGILATHSCSYHMPTDLFAATVISAAQDLKRKVRIIETRTQSHDHPILAGYPESHYLKSVWLQMLD